MLQKQKYFLRVSVLTANRDQKLQVFRGVRPPRVESRMLMSRQFWMLLLLVDQISAIKCSCIEFKIRIVLANSISSFPNRVSITI